MIGHSSTGYGRYAATLYEKKKKKKSYFAKQIHSVVSHIINERPLTNLSGWLKAPRATKSAYVLLRAGNIFKYFSFRRFVSEFPDVAYLSLSPLIF